MILATWIPLVFIPPVLVLVVWLVRRKDWFPGRRRRILTTAALAAAAILFAMCDPAVNIRWGAAPSLVFLGDASPSMRDGQPWNQAAHWVRRELPPDDRFGVVAFSGSAQVAVAPGRSLPAEIDLAKGLTVGPSTNIEQAVRTAMALADDPERTALLLYSDGYETEGDALAAAAEARDRGFRLYTLPPAKPPEPANVAIVDLEHPEQVEADREFLVRAAVAANREGSVTVVLDERPTDGAAAERLGEVAITLEKAVTRWVEFPVTFIGAGRRSLELRLVSAEPDAVPEDGRWPLDILVGDRKPLLVLDYTPAGVALVLPADLLADQPAESREALLAPASAAELGRYAAVILRDVPAHALSAESKAALVEFVRDMGGGLVALGGDNSFGLGGYPRTVLDEMLPVKSDPEERPPVELVVVLDRSASMVRPFGGREKLDLAKEAVLRISALLDQKDRVSLVVFNHEHEVAATSVDTDHWDRLRDRLAGLRATGGTRIGPALDAALELLAATPEKTPDGKEVRRHVIAVSDGIVVGDDGEEPFDPAAMAARARSLGATISVILTGRSDAWTGLEELAADAGGRFYDVSAGILTPTGDNRLARIFTEDLELPVLEKEPAAVAVGARQPIWPDDASPGPFPPVPQHLVTEVKQRAAVHLSAGEKKHPLLATWQYGLGRATAWPVPWNSDDEAWLANTEVARALVSSVAWAARGPVAAADFDVTLSASGGRVTGQVEQRSLAAALAPMPAMQIALTGGAESQMALPLEPVAAGVWRLERSIPAGAYGYALSTGEGNDRRLVRRGTLSTGPSLEFRHLDNNDAFLSELAAAGGGRMLRRPADAADIVIAATRRSELWPYLLGLAGLAVLYEAMRDLFSRGR